MSSKKKSFYRFVYLDFIKSEIPSFIQIIGFPALFGAFFKTKYNAIFYFIIPPLVALLLGFFLDSRLRLFVVNNSFSYEESEEILQTHKKYVIPIAFWSGFFCGLIIATLR